MPKQGDLAALARMRHHSYSLNPQLRTNFFSAVERFKAKVNSGRYRYRQPGGAIGWISSSPGTRGINCADFVIKILGEAGIANLGHRLFDRPRRVSG